MEKTTEWGGADRKVVIGDAATSALATNAQEDGRIGAMEVVEELIVALGEDATVLGFIVVDALREPEGLLGNIGRRCCELSSQEGGCRKAWHATTMQ